MCPSKLLYFSADLPVSLIQMAYLDQCLLHVFKLINPTPFVVNDFRDN